MELIVPPAEIRTTTYRTYTFMSEMINVATLLSVKPGRYTAYPDNIGVPTIEFQMVNSKIISWFFPNQGNAERDNVLAQIEVGNTRPTLIKDPK